MNGKLETTGHAYGDTYEYDPADPNKTIDYGNELTTQCKVFNIAENDEVTNIKVLSGAYGVTNIAIQTIETPETIIGYI